MKKRIIEFPRRVISLFFILSVLLISACGSESQRANDSQLEEKTDHDHTGHNHGGHDHHSGDDFIDLSSITDPPNVSIVAIPDSQGGVRLEIELENFELVPLDAPKGNQPREGHLHVKLDGKMVAMLSEKNYYLSDLSNGQHEIVVSLSSIDHQSFSLNGKLIADTATVTIS